MLKLKSKISRKVLANAIRALSIDAIDKANSGHPGAPLGMADIAEVLWNDFFKHNPKNPHWWNRDRFVLSNGHASMLLYALLHLSGYDISMEDLKNFRQFHSKTPGHPEFGHTPGVETTTGPLGQGFANAIGMALAEKILAQQFNQNGFPIIDHYTYVFVGDGCLMEGISHEAASLAGKWQLEKLIVFYDNNSISIDGNVKGWFIDDTKKRFESYHWNVIDNIDGHNPDEIKNAIKESQKSKKPTLLICNTIIGFGSPNKAGKESVHGAPLGKEESKLTKESLGWFYPPFEIPQEIYDAFDARKKGQKWEEEWNELFKEYKKKYPELARELERRMSYKLPNVLEQIIDRLKNTTIEKEATRKTSLRVLNQIKPYLPELIGGSADLTHSNLTLWDKGQDITIDFKGDYIYYGVREFGMFSIMNGIFLHGGFRPFGGTFLVFSDYGRNAIRMSALMKLGVIYVFTHDSIALGEDGPTHQPIEHLPSLRLIPNLQVWRPYNYDEVLVSWIVALKNIKTPTALILSRQNINMFYNKKQFKNIEKGAYIIYESYHNNQEPIVIISSGSEVEISMELAKELERENYSIKVISMPCMEVFREQSKKYKEKILGNNKKLRFAIEASHPQSWYEWVEPDHVFGIKEFGASAPGDILMQNYGFTIKNLKKFILFQINR